MVLRSVLDTEHQEQREKHRANIKLPKMNNICNNHMKKKTRPTIDPCLPVFGRTFPLLFQPHKEEVYGSEAEQIYAKGMNLIVDGLINEGIDLLEESYRKGYLTAGNTLAYGYSAGWFGERDYVKHIQILRKLVKKKYAPALCNYAFAYEYGLGVKRNIRLALYWYEKAAESGYITALNNLAHFYIFRETIYKDIPRGLQYAIEAAECEDEEAQNALGLCYEEGLGVEKNYEEAFKWFSLAVKNGAGPCALKNLARCYREGKGVAIDKRKADKLERQAIKLGYKKELWPRNTTL